MVQLVSGAVGDPAQADFRQLRHHTKNALAQILAQVSTGLSRNERSRAVAAEVERRVMLTAQIADSLFGLTRAPGPFDRRLAALCDAVVALIGEDDQYLTLVTTVHGEVPPKHQETVLRVAHEFVGNAVKHGMPMRLIGRIEVVVMADATGTVLDVIDDGWGCGCRPERGEGMGIAHALATAMGGQIVLERRRDRTFARLELPAVRHDA
jgi:two-component sensor histidine kinase